MAVLRDRDEVEAWYESRGGHWRHGVARPEQLAPTDPDWDVWLLLAGRGFGKSRTGAEWVIEQAILNPGCRIALVAPTAADCRDIMVEGESGLKACAPPGLVRYEPSKRLVTFANGSIATMYSADEPDRLRGPQHHYAWCDELASWRRLQGAWDMLQMTMRLGKHPRTCITTTPRPLALVKALLKDDAVRVVRGSTYDNLHNLAPTFRRSVVSKYEGTTLGRQELDAEVLEDLPGAMVARRHIEEHRIRDGKHPELIHITVGMDPAGTGEGDETGLVVVGRGVDGRDYVLDDGSARMSPLDAALTAYGLLERWGASLIVVEDNGGKDWIELGLRTAWKMHLKRQGPPPFRRINASQGKRLRAQPVAMRYEQGRVSHVGTFTDLEDQMTTWIPEEEPHKSPDRLDALVHAIAYHQKRHDRGEAAIASPTTRVRHGVGGHPLEAARRRAAARKAS